MWGFVIGVREERLVGLNLRIVFGTIFTEVYEKEINGVMIVEYVLVVKVCENVFTAIRFPLWEICDDFFLEVCIYFGGGNSVRRGLNFIYTEGTIIFELIEDSFGDMGPEFDEDGVIIVMRGDFEDVVVTTEFVVAPGFGEFTEMR